MNFAQTFGWVPILLISAVLEVGGDALIRKGLRTGGFFFIALGFIILGCYGLLVNVIRWDFSKLLGVYVAVFAVVSVLAGRYFFAEVIPVSTWLGLAVVIVGSLIIQMGR